MDIKFDYEVDIDDIGSIPRTISGIYAFYSSDDDVLYVGMAKNIYSRIKLHLGGTYSQPTSRYKHLFNKVKVIKHDDVDTLYNLETKIINSLYPVINMSQVGYSKSGIILKLEDTSICSANNYDGTTCSRKATYNGFCVNHDPLQSEISPSLRSKYITIEMLRLLKTHDFPKKVRTLYFHMSKYTLGRLLREDTYLDIQYKKEQPYDPVFKFKNHYVKIDDDDTIRLTRWG